MTDMSASHFHDEDAAREHIEASRWPNGSVTCPHCGSFNVMRMGGKTQAGMFLCRDCADKFTCRTGTVMERSHIPLHKWLLAMMMLSSSKKGMSAHQMHRTIGITYKSAWFLCHRIREAMRTGGLAPMGGAGTIVEIDETFIGSKPGVEKRRGYAHKHIVLSLVERGGSVRSFHVDSTKREDIIPIVQANIAKETHVMTDESNTYKNLGDHFAKHDAVDHGREEWGYTDRKTGVKVNTNTAEATTACSNVA
jgi:transposase-like protein